MTAVGNRSQQDTHAAMLPMALLLNGGPCRRMLCVQVATYHVSTLSVSQRAAAAKAWLTDTGLSSTSRPAGLDKTAGCRRTSSSSAADSSGSSSQTDGDEALPDLLETILVNEYCQGGSLEGAVKLGRFKKTGDGQPDMVSIR